MRRRRRQEEAADAFTLEATSWLEGLGVEFQEQVKRHSVLTKHLLQLEARIAMSEKALCAMRDQLQLGIAESDTALPKDWQPTIQSVKFVGVRLTLLQERKKLDACLTLLQERKKLTPEDLVLGLNAGMFRFRTNSPLREIHAALLRQAMAKKVGGAWVWVGGRKVISMRSDVSKPIIQPVEDSSDAGTGAT